jgi:uncharacterized protein DUF559
MAMPAAVPGALRDAPFRGSDAVRAGLLRKSQLKGSTWRRLFMDVYVHGSVALTHLARCQAVALILPAGAALSGGSAAYLLGADVLAVDAPVEVTVPPRLRMPRHPGVVTRYAELRPEDVVVRSGLPMTAPVRTAFDLARRRGLEEAVVAVDAMLRACRLQRDAIAAYAGDGRSAWHRVGRLSAVLALVAPGAESPMETRLRLALSRAGLPRPVLQHEVRTRSGAFVARLDLAYVDARLVVEYDGECHLDPDAVRRDLRRQNAPRALGWSLLRFTADDVLRSPARLVAQVEAALAAPLP